jgi:hypothetical protein
MAFSSLLLTLHACKRSHVQLGHDEGLLRCCQNQVLEGRLTDEQVAGREVPDIVDSPLSRDNNLRQMTSTKIGKKCSQGRSVPHNQYCEKDESIIHCGSMQSIISETWLPARMFKRSTEL